MNRAWLPLSADMVMGITPAQDGNGATVWVEGLDRRCAVDFAIDGKDAAYNARRLAALLTLAAECVGPRDEPAGVEDETGWLEDKLGGPVGRSPLTTRSDRTEATERLSDPGGYLMPGASHEPTGP